MLEEKKEEGKKAEIMKSWHNEICQLIIHGLYKFILFNFTIFFFFVLSSFNFFFLFVGVAPPSLINVVIQVKVTIISVI